MRWLAPLLVAGWLAGCATPGAMPSVSDPLWAAHSARVALIDAWQLRGRVAVTEGQRGWSAGLRWTQHGERYRIELSGPLGQGAVSVVGDGGGVTATLADGRVYAGEDADRLVSAATGFDVPVSGLAYWLRGLPGPGPGARLEADAAGRATRIHQAGWEVAFGRYAASAIDGVDLPDRISAQRDALRVRLVVEQWQPAL